MLRKLVSLSFLFLFLFSFAQQNEEFKMVKNYFDNQRSILGREFQKHFDQEVSSANKTAIQNDFQEFMQKLDSIQNNAYVNTLIRVKIKEDLNSLQSQKTAATFTENPGKSDITSSASYPEGFNVMRQQISDLFCTDSILSEQKIMRTELLFVVEKDGSIGSVKAEGDHFTFNRQAEIALYLLPEKFSPAMVNGKAVPYRFRMPLTIDLTIVE